MALFNYATKEITIKIVYYGPGLSGKTTNLQYLHSVLDPSMKGKLLSLATEADRTLFFDFLPVELGKLRDFSIRFQLYTVPGQVRYNATRKLVLKGADGIIFVADSQREMREQNIESMKNMHENLIDNNIDPEDIPLILQYNKRDLQNILSIDELDNDLNANGKYEYKESIAIDGTSVEETFKDITKLVIKGIAKKHKIQVQPPEGLEEVIEAEIPSEETGVIEPIPEEPATEIPIIQSSRYESPEIVQATYDTADPECFRDDTADIKEEPVQQVVEEEAAPPKEVIVKEIIREVPLIPVEKLETVISGINDISQTLKGLKDADSKSMELVSELLTEIRETKKEQKKMNDTLRDLKTTFKTMKTKKRWFRFS